MAKRKRGGDSTADVLAEHAESEKRLLKRERRAERDLSDLRDALADDESRLERAQQRVARRREEIVAAEERLRERQAERAAGPNPPEPDQSPDASAAFTAVADAHGKPDRGSAPASSDEAPAAPVKVPAGSSKTPAGTAKAPVGTEKAAPPTKDAAPAKPAARPRRTRRKPPAAKTDVDSA